MTGSKKLSRTTMEIPILVHHFIGDDDLGTTDTNLIQPTYRVNQPDTIPQVVTWAYLQNRSRNKNISVQRFSTPSGKKVSKVVRLAFQSLVALGVQISFLEI